MYLETIKIEKGQMLNLSYHLDRIKKTIGRVLPISTPTSLDDLIYKYRIVYNQKGILSATYSPYTIRPIKTIQLVVDNKIDYSFKYQKREELNNLFKKRGNCDDIIIVKNSFLTDSSYCNLVFENKEGLFTPTTPLLLGTKRDFLLKNKKIKERSIKISDLGSFERVRFINAMIDLEDNIAIELINIKNINND